MYILVNSRFLSFSYLGMQICPVAIRLKSTTLSYHAKPVPTNAILVHQTVFTYFMYVLLYIVRIFTGYSIYVL